MRKGETTVNPIVLRPKRAYNPLNDCIGTIRLTTEAELVIRKLKEKTGLSFRQIAPEIIVQAANSIVITGEAPVCQEEPAQDLEDYTLEELAEELFRRCL